jgi:hypothetical protein
MSGNEHDASNGRGTQSDRPLKEPKHVGGGTATQTRSRDPHDHDPHDHDPHDHDPHDHDHDHDPHHHHEHEHEHESLAPSAFPHEKLDAYRIALQMVVLAKRLATQIPRGNRSIADHLLRAASNVVLLLADGARSVSASSTAGGSVAKSPLPQTWSSCSSWAHDLMRRH